MSSFDRWRGESSGDPVGKAPAAPLRADRSPSDEEGAINEDVPAVVASKPESRPRRRSRSSERARDSSRNHRQPSPARREHVSRTDESSSSSRGRGEMAYRRAPDDERDDRRSKQQQQQHDSYSREDDRRRHADKHLRPNSPRRRRGSSSRSRSRSRSDSRSHRHSRSRRREPNDDVGGHSGASSKGDEAEMQFYEGEDNFASAGPGKRARTDTDRRQPDAVGSSSGTTSLGGSAAAAAAGPGVRRPRQDTSNGGSFDGSDHRGSHASGSAEPHRGVGGRDARQYDSDRGSSRHDYPPQQQQPPRDREDVRLPPRPERGADDRDREGASRLGARADRLDVGVGSSSNRLDVAFGSGRGRDGDRRADSSSGSIRSSMIRNSSSSDAGGDAGGADRTRGGASGGGTGRGEAPTGSKSSTATGAPSGRGRLLPSIFRDALGSAASAIEKERARVRAAESAAAVAAAAASSSLSGDRDRLGSDGDGADGDAAAAVVDFELRRTAAASRARARAGSSGSPSKSEAERDIDGADAEFRGSSSSSSAAVSGGAQSSRWPSPSPGRSVFSSSSSSSSAAAAQYNALLHGCRSVNNYKPLAKIDEGTYGVVFSAEDIETREVVALKKVKMGKVATNEGFPITALRETNILLMLRHPNIITVREMVVGSQLDKVYMVMDYMDHDVKSLMSSMTQPFTQAEVKCLMQQLLRGVAFMHANWVVHRDLKTSNLLMNNSGRLVICDFGMARLYGSPLRAYTQPVVTLWYRAPELLLGMTHYGTAVDLFSVGCIFAEFLTKGPLFPARSGTDAEMLNLIFAVMGTPSEDTWPGWSSLPAAATLRMKPRQPQSLRQALGIGVTGYGNATAISDAGLDLLRSLLTLDPSARITAADALQHRWFSESPPPLDERLMPAFRTSHHHVSRHSNAVRSPPAPAVHEHDEEEEEAAVDVGAVSAAAAAATAAPSR